MQKEIITPIQYPRKPMKGVATGIPEALKVRSLDHVRAAMVYDRVKLRSGELVHEVDKHGRHHRITFSRNVDGQRQSGEWTRIHHGCLFQHLGKTYVAYSRAFFEGKIMDGDILARKLDISIKRLALKGRK
jgi:hypothetical protein